MTDVGIFLSAYTSYDTPESYFSSFIIGYDMHITPLKKSVLIFLTIIF